MVPFKKKTQRIDDIAKKTSQNQILQLTNPNPTSGFKATTPFSVTSVRSVTLFLPLAVGSSSSLWIILLRQSRMSSEPLKPKKPRRNPLDIPPTMPFDRRYPRVQLALSVGTTFCTKKEALNAAHIALSSWNAAIKTNKGPKYELLEVAGCLCMIGPFIIHCNFIARPRTRSRSEADHKLFFAELKYLAKNEKDYALGCNLCCILGPVGTKTGLAGCLMCEKHPDIVQHPENRDFTKGRSDHLEKATVILANEEKLATMNRPGSCSETELTECAMIALSSWNAKSVLEQGPEYELYYTIGGKRIAGPTIYHCNFVARPKNVSEPKSMLFFAELKYSKDFGKDGEDVALGCRVCCILGPTGTETGIAGCSICKSYPILINHPKNEDFIKGRKDALSKFTANKPSEIHQRSKDPLTLDTSSKESPDAILLMK